MQRTVCIVTSIHPDYDARIYKHCLSVRDLGYRTVFISPWADRGLDDGIEYMRFERGKGLTGRLANMRAIWRLMKKARADLYHFHDLDLVPVMGLWKLCGGKPVIYDVHENYGEEMRYRYSLPKCASWLLSKAVSLTERIGTNIIRNAVIVVDVQRAKFDRPPIRAAMIRNYASISLLDTVKDDWSDRPPAVILNASAYVNNGLLLFLDVAELVLAKRNDVTFYFPDRFGGTGPLRGQALDRVAKPPLAGHVEMLPNVLPDHIMDNLNRATFGAAFDLRTPSRVKALPTKLFEYMAAGLPIVATDLPNSVHYVNAAACGLLGRPEAPQSLADAVEHLLADPGQARAMGLRGRQAFEDRYNWESQNAVYARFYGDILGK